MSIKSYCRECGRHTRMTICRQCWPPPPNQPPHKGLCRRQALRRGMMKAGVTAQDSPFNFGQWSF